MLPKNQSLNNFQEKGLCEKNLTQSFQIEDKRHLGMFLFPDAFMILRIFLRIHLRNECDLSIILILYAIFGLTQVQLANFLR
ncbi:hypothetical protein, partial [Bacillus litorisediminis]|uniref:hypothetical protein n=1 Tax=Bacillus litorisediminis TaxID=2922713 RepID=UPI001FACA66B